MTMITQAQEKNKRYLPHELTTKVHAVKLYRQTKDVGFVLRWYHISKASLMRWNTKKKSKHLGRYDTPADKWI